MGDNYSSELIEKVPESDIEINEINEEIIIKNDSKDSIEVEINESNIINININDNSNDNNHQQQQQQKLVL